MCDGPPNAMTIDQVAFAKHLNTIRQSTKKKAAYVYVVLLSCFEFAAMPPDTEPCGAVVKCFGVVWRDEVWCCVNT